LIDVGVEMEIIDKSGTWLSFGEHKLGQGRDAAKTFLKEHPEVYTLIEKKIKERVGLIPAALLPSTADKEKAELKKEREIEKEPVFVPAEKAKLALKK